MNQDIIDYYKGIIEEKLAFVADGSTYRIKNWAANYKGKRKRTKMSDLMAQGKLIRKPMKIVRPK